jgi:hypothetical protein
MDHFMSTPFHSRICDIVATVEYSVYENKCLFFASN